MFSASLVAGTPRAEAGAIEVMMLDGGEVASWLLRTRRYAGEVDLAQSAEYAYHVVNRGVDEERSDRGDHHNSDSRDNKLMNTATHGIRTGRE